MNTKYILVPDSAVFQLIRQATLYRLTEGEKSNPLAPRYTAVRSGPVEELAAIAAQLNAKEQEADQVTGEGADPVPLGTVDPLAEMEVDNLDRIVHDTKPHDQDYRDQLNELARGLQRLKNTTGRDEPVLTDDQWTRLTDDVPAFLMLHGDTVKVSDLARWLRDRPMGGTLRIRQVDGKVQMRVEL